MEGSSLLKFFYLVSMLCLVTSGMLLCCIDEWVKGRVGEWVNRSPGEGVSEWERGRLVK
jgi:hypothetical protein